MDRICSSCTPYQGRYLTYLGKLLSHRMLAYEESDGILCSLQPWTRQSGKRCANPFIFLNILGH
jgi:hypothetical protein